eukprot:16057-Eustigmatos_ZCMA.PRE.1
MRTPYRRTPLVLALRPCRLRLLGWRERQDCTPEVKDLRRQRQPQDARARCAREVTQWPTSGFPELQKAQASGPADVLAYVAHHALDLV